MSSALSTAARDDVDIVYDTVPLSSEGLSTLWQLLQDTCVDATHGTRQHSDIWELAQSCIYFGSISKLVEAPQPEADSGSNEAITTIALPKAQRKHVTPRHLRPWGYVHHSWKSPTESAPFSDSGQDEGQHDEESYELARLRDDFNQRVLAEKLLLDSQNVTELGKLRKHGTFSVGRGRDVKVLEVYLFERKLVFIPPSTAPLSPSTPSRLRVIRLADIVNIAPKRKTSRGGELELCSRSQSGEVDSLIMFLDDDPDQLLVWGAAISRLVSETCVLRFAPWQSGAVDASRGLAPRLPLENFHSFRKFSPVTISSGKRTGECGAYLFDDMLLFISRDAYDVLRVHTRIELSTVQFVANRSAGGTHVVGLRTLVGGVSSRNSAVSGADHEPERIYTDYNFAVASQQLVAEWLDALKTQLLALDPAHPLGPPRPPAKPAAPAKNAEADDTPPTWSLAGIVFLTASPDTAGEYNLGVAVLPQFASSGLATHAIAQVLQKAFETLGAHRVQARVFRGDAHCDPARAVAKFVQLGFAHEGVRRRAAMHPVSRCWTDLSVLSVLDVDWTVRMGVPPPPRSMWDEMFDRHQREREHLLSWDGGRLKRTRSMETVKDLRALADAAPTASESGIDDDAQSTTSSVQPPPSQFGASTTSWDAVSEPSEPASAAARVQTWTSQLLATAADDAADEFSSDSWDDFEDDEDAVEDSDDE